MDLTQPTIIKQPSNGFWKTGLVLALTVAAVILGEGAQYVASVDAITTAAVQKVRSGHPDAAWAFEEWDACQHGRGRYADGQKPVYFTSDQCTAAVAAQAEQRGTEGSALSALDDQSTAAAAAQSTVKPAWPLSLLF